MVQPFYFERQFGSSSKVKYSLDNMTDLIMLQTIYPVELKVMSLQKAMHHLFISVPILLLHHIHPTSQVPEFLAITVFLLP